MSRRDFLKRLVGLGVALVNASLPRLATAADASAASMPSPYGTGAYGQDAYSAYGIYLPLVSQEES